MVEEEREEEGERRASVAAKIEKETYTERGRTCYEREGERGEESPPLATEIDPRRERKRTSLFFLYIFYFIFI